jgi:hypothetical protein
MGKKPTIDRLRCPGRRDIVLLHPICDYKAQRIEQILPQIHALNEANKSQTDASCALGLSCETLRNYVRAAGIKWRNIQPRVTRPKHLRA